MMQVVLPEASLPAKITLNPESRMSDADYHAFCMANADVRFERTVQGDIIIVAPAGGESDYRNTEIVGQLRQWAKRDGRGKVFGPSAEFILPDGAALSPDAAWVSNASLAKLTRQQRRGFPPLCPEFVVEVMSPSDRLKASRQKMKQWMANGARLGWLIDADNETVYVFRPGRLEGEKRHKIAELAGEGPVAGLQVDLADVWTGL